VKMIMTLLLAISSLSVLADSQPKVGFVNVDELLTTTEIWGTEYKQLTVAKWNQTHVERSRTLENEIRELERQNAALVMDTHTRQKINARLKQKKSELRRIQDGALAAIEFMQETMMEVLRPVVEEYARYKGFSIIYEYKPVDSSVFYVKPALDITADLAATLLALRADSIAEKESQK